MVGRNGVKYSFLERDIDIKHLFRMLVRVCRKDVLVIACLTLMIYEICLQVSSQILVGGNVVKY